MTAKYMIGAMRKARWRSHLLTVFLVLCAAAPAAAKSYSADRFDAVIRVLPDGMLDVTETVIFRFADGAFREVFREIPTRRTDGIEILRAEMQGEPLPFGGETGTVEVRQRRNSVRVVWRFAALEGVVREFVLNYRVRGVIRQQQTADLLVWRATPGEHRYRIDSSAIRFELPMAPAGPPVVTTRKTDPPQVSLAANVVRIETSAIGSNGWIDTTLRFPPGALVEVPPAWQQHAAQVAARSSAWMMGTGVVAAAGLMLLMAWRQSYDAPRQEPRLSGGHGLQTTPPDTVAPAVAGVLGANGRAGLEHAMASLFSLADRGAIDITELPRGTLGQRDFLLTRRRGPGGAPAGYEEAVLETIFKGQANDGNTITLSQARSRLSLRPGAFSRAMNRELLSAGFLDEARSGIRRRYITAAGWFLVLGIIGFAPAVLLMPQHDGWPMLIPVTILALALCAVFFAATITPLSNDGVRRARHWRDYRKHLRAVAEGKQAATGLPTSTVLPFAIALGLASAWSKLLKQRREPTPAWFHAIQDSDPHTAFPAFIATSGAGATGGHGGGGGGGAGAAGGGASGAS